jgi:translation initiation factor 2B subunit (eIF-2B alpha/beta/delta family)
MDKGLEEIFSDKESGSTTIALKLNSYLKSISDDSEKVSETVKLLKQNFKSFSIISYYLENISESLKNNSQGQFILSFENDVRNSDKNIYNNAKNDLLKLSSVYTLSNSNTLLEFFRLWHKDNPELKVNISESRPANEGRLLANSLLEEGIGVCFSIDAAAAEQIQLSDAVITGADMILANGDIINKTGSLPAAICCRHYNKPFYVAASKYKFSKNFIYNTEPQDPDEVWPRLHQNLKIVNYHFEEIPAALITKIFSD